MHRVGVGPCPGTTGARRHFEENRGEGGWGGSLTTALSAPSPPAGGEGKGEGADASVDRAEPIPHARIAQRRSLYNRP